ncbi:MAG TPA: DUF2946 family protein [Aquabacterium sp.]|nr:DUF2946 family protein [Aquabacterium sp.]
MQAAGISRRIHLALVALAMMAASWWVTGGHASAGATPDFLTEVCSAAHPGSSSAPDSPHDLGHCFKHCLQCSLLALGSPLSHAGLVLPMLLGARMVPVLFLSAPRGLFAWQPLQARAPPYSLMT